MSEVAKQFQVDASHVGTMVWGDTYVRGVEAQLEAAQAEIAKLKEASLNFHRRQDSVLLQLAEAKDKLGVNNPIPIYWDCHKCSTRNHATRNACRSCGCRDKLITMKGNKISEEKAENKALRELLAEVIDKGDDLRRFTSSMSDSKAEAFAVNEWGRIKAKAIGTKQKKVINDRNNNKMFYM